MKQVITAALLVLMTVLFLSSVVQAQDATASPETVDSSASIMPTSDAVPDDLQEVVGLVPTVVAAFKGGEYALAVGLIVMILVFIFNTYLVKGIPGEYLPWVSIAVGVVIAVGTALISGSGITDAVVGGVTTGLAGAGAWSAGGKALFKVLPTPEKTAQKVAEDAADRVMKKARATGNPDQVADAVENALNRLRGSGS